MADDDRPITELLRLLGQGDRRGLDDLMEVLRTTLLRRCRRQVGKVPGGALTGTELLDELYLYLAKRFPNLPKLANRDSFFAYAHEAMKHLAMDARRKERAKRRGGHMRGVSIEDLRDDIPDKRPDQEWVEIFEVLARVEAQDPEVAEMAKLRVLAASVRERAAAARRPATRRCQNSGRVQRAATERRHEPRLAAASGRSARRAPYGGPVRGLAAGRVSARRAVSRGEGGARRLVVPGHPIGGRPGYRLVVS